LATELSLPERPDDAPYRALKASLRWRLGHVETASLHLRSAPEAMAAALSTPRFHRLEALHVYPLASDFPSSTWAGLLGAVRCAELGVFGDLNDAVAARLLEVLPPSVDRLIVSDHRPERLVSDRLRELDVGDALPQIAKPERLLAAVADTRSVLIRATVLPEWAIGHGRFVVGGRGCRHSSATARSTCSDGMRRRRAPSSRRRV
jgi:hypothetical protein